jgi:WD40 repeat protein
MALTNGAEIGRLPAGAGAVRGAAYDPDGRSVVTDDSVSLSRWDLVTGEEIWREFVGTFTFWEIALSPDGRHILTSDMGNTASLWDAATGELIRRLPGNDSVEGHTADTMVDSVAFHPGGKFGLSGGQGEERSLIYWDLETGQPVWVFDAGSVEGVAISPDGHTALSAESVQFRNGQPDESRPENPVNWWNLETELIRPCMGTNYV